MKIRRDKDILRTATKTKEDLIQDERSVRINEKAGYHAFRIIIGCIALLVVVDWYSKLTFKDVDGPLFIVGMFSWIILRWYYDKRGNIE